MKCGSRVFRVGDRIMQTVNRINVSNGDVGIITDVETEDDDTIARVKLLDGRELSYTQEMLEDLEFPTVRPSIRAKDKSIRSSSFLF